MQRLARFVVRRRGAVILSWIALLIITTVIGSSAFSVLSTDFGAGTSTESGRVAAELDDLAETGLAPHTRVLCTSQVVLGVAGESAYELEPLGLDDSVELFTQRAAAHRRNRSHDDDVSVVHDLCRALDGLPLAIELAAARTKTLSIAEISRRLDHRFEVLSDPTSRKPERRRALRATIRWSYELLFPDDQRGLWALAMFAGGATLPGVERVLEPLGVPARTAIDVVGRLAARSLVLVNDPGGGGQLRYRLLDSIRAFALDALDAGGLDDAAHRAHAAWLVELAGASTSGVRSGDQARHLAVARAERANVDAALHWCITHDPAAALAIVNGFGWAWIVLGDSRAVQRILAALAAAGDGAPPGERATALLLASWIEASTGELVQAEAHIDEAEALARSGGDRELLARAAYYRAYVVSHDGAFELGLELTDRSRALYAGLDRPWDLAANALFAARAAVSAGDAARAEAATEHARATVGAVDDPWLEVRLAAMFGELARLQHRFDEAVEHLARAAATSHRLGFQQTEAYQVASLGRAQCQAGDYLAGAATLELAIDKAEATGDLRMAALARVHLGRVLRALGERNRARAVLEHATAWHRAAGGGEQAVLGECLLAALDAADGVPGAIARVQATLDDARRAANAPVEVLALDALARAAAAAGDAEQARELGGRADARMGEASHFISESDRTDAAGWRG